MGNETEEINSDATKKVVDVKEGREIVSQTYNDNVQADNNETDNCEGEVNSENNALEIHVTIDEVGKEEFDTHEMEEENLNKEDAKDINGIEDEYGLYFNEEDVTDENEMEDEYENKEEGRNIKGEENEKEENNSSELEEEKLIKKDVTN